MGCGLGIQRQQWKNMKHIVPTVKKRGNTLRRLIGVRLPNPVNYSLRIIEGEILNAIAVETMSTRNKLQMRQSLIWNTYLKIVLDLIVIQSSGLIFFNLETS